MDRQIHVQTEKLLELQEIGKQMNNQNNRATAFPLFVILVDKYINVGYDADWDKKERVDRDNLVWSNLCDKCTELLNNDEELPEDCEECSLDAFVYLRKLGEYESFDLRAGVFLTAEACNQHIKANHYHYDNPRSYAVSAWRNYEMQKVLKFISALATEDSKPTMPYLG